jgi:hypothetical protein
VIAFAGVAGVVSIMVITVLSAYASRRTVVRRDMADPWSTPNMRSGRAIVATQVAIALVITLAGTLVAGSLVRVWSEDPGFDPRRLAVVEMSAPTGSTGQDMESLVAMIGRIPGIRASGATGHPLLQHAFNGSAFDSPAGVAPDERSSGFPIESVPVTHGYFEAAGLSFRDGRAPTEAEFASGAATIVVSDTVAGQYWPGARAVGQTLRNGTREYTVTGVVPDARFMALDLEPQGEIYWPVAAMPSPYVATVLVRLDASGDATLSGVVSEIRRLCPTCWVREAQTFDELLADTIKPRRFSAWLFSAFGVAALVIVGAGMLGLVAMAVVRRTREIGLRLALGATGARVIGQMLGEQILPVAIGLGAGAIAGAWLVRLLTDYLYKTSVYDLRSWSAGIAALVCVVLAGTLVPAIRASRIEPARTLKE